MGSGEWGVGSGEWGVGSGEWGVESKILIVEVDMLFNSLLRRFVSSIRLLYTCNERK